MVPGQFGEGFVCLVNVFLLPHVLRYDQPNLRWAAKRGRQCCAVARIRPRRPVTLPHAGISKK